MPGELLAVRHSLRPLVLMMREHEVLTAAVELEPFAQQVERHDDALRVPSRTSGAPRGLPARLSRLRLLPQHEVQRRALLLVRLDPGASPQRVQRLTGQEPVARDIEHRQIDPGGRLVRHPAAHQIGDEVDHAVDVGGGVGNLVRSEHAERVHDLPPQGLVSRGELRNRHALGRSPVDDLVLDISDVGDIGDLETAEQQVAAEHVEDEGEPAVSEVRHPVDRRTADVEADLAGLA